MNSKLQQWISAAVVGDEMLWKGAWGAQLQFVRDRLTYLVARGLRDWEDVESVPNVISTHRSKSIVLPVYELSRPDLGLRLILRGNFHDWKISVLSETPIVADFSCLFHTTPPVEPDYTGNELSDCYFEGFPRDLVFGYYEPSDKRRWSCCVGGEYEVYMVVFEIMRALGAVKPVVWNTKAAHRKYLDEQAAIDKATRERRERREAAQETR